MGAKRWFAFFISIIFCCAAKAQDNRISITFNNVSLEKALTALITEQKVALSYNQEILPPGVIINKSFNDAPIKYVMDYLLAGTQLTYKFSGQGIIILPGKTNRVILSGRVKDSISGEDLVGSTVYIPSLKLGVATNNYGYFSLLLPAGDYGLSVSQVGYKRRTIPIALKASQNQVIFLKQQTDSLKEIAVRRSSRDDTLLTVQPGTPFSLDFMQKHPSKGGDPDVLKSLQMQTGIERMSGNSSSFFVHGGSKDQNLILFDEAPVYNPAHLYGFVSIFNPDAVNHIQVYKNDIPANFGGRLSSVVDTRMNDGNNKEFHIKGGISLLSARLSAEGPIVKERGSFLVTFRRGLTDFLNEYVQLYNIKGTYYDFNVKLNYNLNAKNRVFYSTYAGFDHLLSRNDNQNNWGNFTSTLRWNHLFSDRLFSNISAIYSNYYNQLNINANKLTNRFTWDTGIRDLILKTDLTFYQAPESIVKIGINGTLHNFVPGESSQKFFSSIDGSIPRQRALENAAYISHQFELQNKISINYGLRFSWFDNFKETIQPDSASLSSSWKQESASGKIYFKVEPRLSVIYKLSPSQRLNFAYNRNYQYLQLIQNDELSFSSLEMWLPADNHIAPQSADFYSTGYKVFFDIYSFAFNGYYKKMTGQLDLASHAQIILNPNVEGEIHSGRSDAYGTEINLSKTAGRLQGDLGYTWSRVNKRIATINNDQSYPANYDVPNDLKLALTYLLSSRLSLNSFFTYKTGRPVTLPVGYYYQNGVEVPIYEDKNASRFPDYNRLDISMELKPKAKNKEGRHWQSTWVASVYNVYNRKNLLFFRIDKTAKNRYSSGISPAISYNFKF